jgi:hypothetical protein
MEEMYEVFFPHVKATRCTSEVRQLFQVAIDARDSKAHHADVLSHEEFINLASLLDDSDNPLIYHADDSRSCVNRFVAALVQQQ